MIKSTALWFSGKQQVDLKTTEIKNNTSDSYFIHSLYSAISTGTESLVLSGKDPRFLHD